MSPIEEDKVRQSSWRLSSTIRGSRVAENPFKQKAGFLYTSKLSCEMKKSKNDLFLLVGDWMFWAMIIFSNIFFSNTYETDIQTLWDLRYFCGSEHAKNLLWVSLTWRLAV